jgi:hypothetical protein
LFEGGDGMEEYKNSEGEGDCRLYVVRGSRKRGYRVTHRRRSVF